MNHHFLKFAAATLLVTGLAATQSCKMEKEHQNPFISEYDTPYDIPPFDKITYDDYIPALKAGIEQQKEAVEAIVNNPAEPTLENTIIALDHSGPILEARIMFMVEATRFAIDRASDKELLGLQEYVYQMENCTDPEKTASLIFEFSHEIAYISGNTLLPLFFVSFRDLVCSLWARYGQKYGTKELYYSAKKIFDCLLARDKEAVKDFITTSTMESIDGSRTIYYVD